MSFKANIDIFVNFSYVRVRFLNRQGYLRFRLKIFSIIDGHEGECHPYNIVKGPIANSEHDSHPRQQFTADSEIHATSRNYFSKLIQVRYEPNDYQLNETVFFKAYVRSEDINRAEFYCEIECMFAENPKEKFRVLGKFKAQIRKIYGLSTYLPITFDAFDGFRICSTFHSTIMEFKYVHEEGSGHNKDIFQNCFDMWSYVDCVTNGFLRTEVLQFYTFYRKFLEREYLHLQDRFQALKSMKKEGRDSVASRGKVDDESTQQTERYSKIKENSDLIKLIEGRSKGATVPSHIIMAPEEQEKIVEKMLKDFSKLQANIYKKWRDFVEFNSDNSTYVTNYYLEQYQLLCKQRFKHNIFSHRIKGEDWKVAKYDDRGQINLELAYKEKKKTNAEEELWNEHFPIQNCDYFVKTGDNIKFFEEIYCTNNQKPLKDLKAVKKHIIFLVHGFHASRYDMFLLKNCLEVTYGVQVIISVANEDKTEDSILESGRRLGTEVQRILMKRKKNYKLSFIGHSLGGLIIRSALPYLKEFSDKFYSFISLSSPHLGYLYQSGTLIRAGLWFLNNMHKCDSILELTMKDKPNYKQTVLYQLSQNNSLQGFQNICFACSSLDEYVVYESARAQRNEKLMSQSLSKSTQETIREMVDGMLGDLTASEVCRINVAFNIPDKNFDSFLGRTGHIRFLSDIQFIREFCSCFDKFFL